MNSNLLANDSLDDIYSSAVGKMWFSEIQEDISELIESRSSIHYDELVVKYGEVGGCPFGVFICKVMRLQYFDTRNELTCQYLYTNKTSFNEFLRKVDNIARFYK